jgi:hypothetical protein
MTKPRVSRRELLGYFLGVGLVETAAPRISLAAEYVIVVHRSVGLIEAPIEKIRKILALRQAQWDDGTPVLLVLPPRHSGPIRWIAEELLGMPETAYRRHILGQVFRGAAREPIQADSIAAVVEAVSTKRAAVSALPRDAIPRAVLAVTLRG